MHDGDAGEAAAAATVPADGDYRVRVASRGPDRAAVERINQELMSLYCSGPAAGGGFRQSVTDQIHTASILVGRDLVRPKVRMVEAAA